MGFGGSVPTPPPPPPPPPPPTPTAKVLETKAKTTPASSKKGISSLKIQRSDVPVTGNEGSGQAGLNS